MQGANRDARRSDAQVVHVEVPCDLHVEVPCNLHVEMHVEVPRK